MMLSLVFMGSCKKNDDSNSGNAQVTMRLTDDAAVYDALYLDIRQVAITMSGHSEVVLTPYRVGVYNILNFRNGLDTLLLRNSIPAGHVQQIRLILGDNNAVVVDGTVHALSTPSAQESGLKLNLHEDFVANGAYDIWLDFDATKSIVVTGNGTYKLKPVIKAYSAQTNGRIQGYVAPLGVFATVYAVNGTDTVTAIPAPDGYFMFSGLTEGTYTIMVVPAVAPYLTFTTTTSVTFGSVTNMGTLTLHN